jgi:DNA-directed RNA polymerase subunit beta'
MSNHLLKSSVSNKTASLEDVWFVVCSIASPEQIMGIGSEVKTPETINYRSFKPERDGLFCEKIFGPTKDYECACGKYKRLKHKGVICEKCGVEVTSAHVRRERMGYITLAAPVVNGWFFRSLPSRIGLVLNMSLKKIERVINFDAYFVLNPGSSSFEKGQFITNEEYSSYLESNEDILFLAETGAEAVRISLQAIDLEAEITHIKADIVSTHSDIKKKALLKRLKVLNALLINNTKPEWMVLTVLPVLPPDLRPLVPLDGGRFASSDLNDLYRLIINRNLRLLRLMELGAPDIVVRNEKRMLQAAVDSLFGTVKLSFSVKKEKKKSLSDILKGKAGLFRQYLLGKRVDYSGRSVIVVGPFLQLNQCGLPKEMALELFKPFVYARLIETGKALTLKAAKRMVDMRDPQIWDALEYAVKDHPVLLNRAPTLHRLGIQAFWPVLTDGKVIQLHPLVCVAYNADFDGDQMAVHLPLSIEAQAEAILLMMSTNHLLSSSNGDPVVMPTKDIVLGIYYLTHLTSTDEKSRLFHTVSSVLTALEDQQLHIHQSVKCLIRHPDGSTQCVLTSPGRLVLFDTLSQKVPFSILNKIFKKKDLSDLLNFIHKNFGSEQMVIMVDDLAKLGFKYATLSGISIGLDDFIVPADKFVTLEKTHVIIEELYKQFKRGLLTYGELCNKKIDLWLQANDHLSYSLECCLQEIGFVNAIYAMMHSGARGSMAQARQLCVMRGLMSKPSGELLADAILNSLLEGLKSHEYFLSGFGARKGLIDTALKTADAGYMSRRLANMVMDIVITMEDCGTTDGIDVTAHIEGGDVIETLQERVYGRFTAAPVLHPDTKNILIPENTLLTDVVLSSLEGVGVFHIKVRSPVKCSAHKGLCATCYGIDLSHNKVVDIGEAVGIIAAQSIGEPGTQLTMRTFHIGGAASRSAAINSISARSDGVLLYDNVRTVTNRTHEHVVISRLGYVTVVDVHGVERERYDVIYGTRLKISNRQAVTAGQLLAVWDPHMRPIIAEANGVLRLNDMIEGLTVRHRVDEVTALSYIMIIEIKQRSTTRELRPSISVMNPDQADHVLANYYLPVGAIVGVENGTMIHVGDTLARIPQEAIKTKDIIGGLPRVADLFEARKPKESAILAEISGVVSFGKETKGKRRLIILDEFSDRQYEILIPKWRSVRALEGESIQKGDMLVDGKMALQDVLRLLGKDALVIYMLNEIQDVYRLQGMKISDKHIEIVIRQMLSKVEVVDSGDSDYLPGDRLHIRQYQELSEQLIKEGRQPLAVVPILMGITKGSLDSDSFLSAASFQDTMRVLTDAAIYRTPDYLAGVRENVIIGRFPPVGTGFAYYHAWRDFMVQYQLQNLHQDVF